MVAKKLGPGKKSCPECGEILGARTMECPKCSHKFEAKTASKPKKGGLLDPRRQIQAVKDAGGLNEVKKAIAAVEKAEEALRALGGVAGARDAVALVEELKAL